MSTANEATAPAITTTTIIHNLPSPIIIPPPLALHSGDASTTTASIPPPLTPSKGTASARDALKRAMYGLSSARTPSSMQRRLDYYDAICRESLGLPELGRWVLELQSMTDKLRYELASKGELAVAKQSSDCLTRALFDKQQRDADIKIQEVAEDLTNLLTTTLAHKADWVTLRINFAEQVNTILKTHTTMLLNEIENKVITTMRNAGMTQLEELAPSQESITDLRFQLQKMEIATGEYNQTLRRVNGQLDEFRAQYEVDRSALEKHMETGLEHLAIELTSKIHKANSGVVELVDETARRIFSESFPSIVNPMETNLKKTKEEVQELRVSMKQTQDETNRRFTQITRDAETLSRQLDLFDAKYAAFSRDIGELTLQITELKKVAGDAAAKARATDARLDGLKESMKKRGTETEAKLKELTVTMEESKQAHQEERRQANMLIEKLNHKGDKMERDMAKLREGLDRTVPYAEFARIAERVAVVDKELGGNRLALLNNKIQKAEETLMTEIEKVSKSTSKYATNADVILLEQRVTGTEKYTHTLSHNLDHKVTELNKNIRSVHDEAINLEREGREKIIHTIDKFKPKAQRTLAEQMAGHLAAMAMRTSMESSGNTMPPESKPIPTALVSRPSTIKPVPPPVTVVPSNHVKVDTTLNEGRVDIQKELEQMLEEEELFGLDEEEEMPQRREPAGRKDALVDKEHKGEGGEEKLASYHLSSSSTQPAHHMAAEEKRLPGGSTIATNQSRRRRRSNKKFLLILNWIKSRDALLADLQSKLASKGDPAPPSLKKVEVNTSAVQLLQEEQGHLRDMVFLGKHDMTMVRQDLQSEVALLRKEVAALDKQLQGARQEIKSGLEHEVSVRGGDKEEVKLEFKMLEKAIEEVAKEVLARERELKSMILKIGGVKAPAKGSERRRPLVFKAKEEEEATSTDQEPSDETPPVAVGVSEAYVREQLESFSKQIEKRQAHFEAYASFHTQRQLKLFQDSTMSKEEKQAIMRLIETFSSQLASFSGDLAAQWDRVKKFEPTVLELRSLLRHTNDRLQYCERALQNFLAANASLKTELKRERRENFKRSRASKQAAMEQPTTRPPPAPALPEEATSSEPDGGHDSEGGDDDDSKSLPPPRYTIPLEKQTLFPNIVKKEFHG